MFWLITSILLGSIGQLFLKMGADSSKHSEGLQSFYSTILFNYNMWLGLGCYVMSFIIWLKVLTHFDLSYARPFLGLGYVVTVFLAMFFLDEKVTPVRWIGIILIIAGIALLGMSSKNS